MIEGTIDNYEVSRAGYKFAVLYLICRLPGIHVQQLKVVVSSQTNAAPPSEKKGTHFHRKGWVKRPNVKAVGSDLRFDNLVDIFPRLRPVANAARHLCQRHGRYSRVRQLI
jgi:hypothetical protein